MLRSISWLLIPLAVASSLSALETEERERERQVDRKFYYSSLIIALTRGARYRQTDT